MGPLHIDPALKTGLLMYFLLPTASKALVRDKNLMYFTYHCSFRKELYRDTVSISTVRVLGTQNTARFMYLQAHDAPYAFIPWIHDKVKAGEVVNQLPIRDGIRWRIIIIFI